MAKPGWLPEIISIDGEWVDVLHRLFEIFTNDFIRTKRTLEHRPVWWDRRVLDQSGLPEGFWHLITRKDQKSFDRFFDPRRAEKLPWCGPTVSNSHDDNFVKFWDYEESSGRIRTYVWLEDWDYIIILEKRRHKVSEIAFLITAYYVDGPATRNRLKHKYVNKRI